jgi:hypothetical protein
LGLIWLGLDFKKNPVTGADGIGPQPTLDIKGQGCNGLKCFSDLLFVDRIHAGLNHQHSIVFINIDQGIKIFFIYGSISFVDQPFYWMFNVSHHRQQKAERVHVIVSFI